MRVERLELTHFRGIRHLELEFPTQITVLVGVNGAGKSAILDAMGLLLSSWVSALLPQGALVEAPPMRRQDVLNGEEENRIALAVRDEEQEGYRWSLSMARSRSWLTKRPDEVTQLSRYMQRLKERFRQRRLDSLPLIAYYATDRGMWLSEMGDEAEGAPTDEIPQGECSA